MRINPTKERAARRSRNNFGRCWFSWLVNGVVWHILKTDSTYEFTFFRSPVLIIVVTQGKPKLDTLSAPWWVGRGVPAPLSGARSLRLAPARPSCIASRINFARPPTLSSARGVAACQSARSRAGIPNPSFVCGAALGDSRNATMSNYDQLLAEAEANRASAEMDAECVPRPTRASITAGSRLPRAGPAPPPRGRRDTLFTPSPAFAGCSNRPTPFVSPPGSSRRLTSSSIPLHPSRRYDSDDVPHAFAAAPTRSPGDSAASSRRSSRRGSRSSHVGSLESLYDTFLAYCNYGVRGVGEDAMDGAKWAKFCRETGLQNRRTLDAVQVDLIFSKVKPRGERKISFEEFKDAVAMVAEMRGRTFADTCALVVSKGGPQSSGTRAEYVKFAEPSNFTGAYAASLGSTPRRATRRMRCGSSKYPRPKCRTTFDASSRSFARSAAGTPGSWRERRSSRFSAIAASSAERCATPPDDDFRRRRRISSSPRFDPRANAWWRLKISRWRCASWRMRSARRTRTCTISS